MPVFGKRRALGQHFLRDTRIIETISLTALDGVQKYGCRTLLEIGPGKGAITLAMLDEIDSRGGAGLERMILAERDRELIEEWKDRAIARENSREAASPGSMPPLVVEGGDFVELEDARWLGAPGADGRPAHAPIAVASNLPYSAGTAILQKLARHPAEIPFMVLMFQAEVAARLRAELGTKAWGSLSIWIQNQWDVRKLISAPPRAFAPPPDVDSEVVVLTRRAEPRVRVDRDPELWERLLKACFAHRRKMLRSGLPDGPMRDALMRSGLDPTLRAEALTWDQWAVFYGECLKG
jgi:16S rRNA (adenine1518-N6/adenine1519-N6)-dimethyltransferase